MILVFLKFVLHMVHLTWQSSFSLRTFIVHGQVCQSASTGSVLSLADLNPELCGDLEQKTIEPLVIFCQKGGNSPRLLCRISVTKPSALMWCYYHQHHYFNLLFPFLYLIIFFLESWSRLMVLEYAEEIFFLIPFKMDSTLCRMCAV